MVLLESKKTQKASTLAVPWALSLDGFYFLRIPHGFLGRFSTDWP